MPEPERDYSDYLHHLALMGSVYTLVCGFTFTTITLFVTTYPGITETRVQMVLLFLTMLFDLFVYLIIWCLTEDTMYCSYLPPMTRRQDIWSNLTIIGLVFWGLSIPAMFLVWRLDLLALVTTVIWLILVPIGYFTLGKRSLDRRRKIAQRE